MIGACKIPPAGWRCTRTAGHEGPCAAIVELAPLNLTSRERQSRADSFMEAMTNIAVGLAVSQVANLVVLPLVLGVHVSNAAALWLGVIYTAISLVRSYVLRRAFNGRSVWAAIKGNFA